MICRDTQSSMNIALVMVPSFPLFFVSYYFQFEIGSILFCVNLYMFFPCKKQINIYLCLLLPILQNENIRIIDVKITRILINCDILIE